MNFGGGVRNSRDWDDCGAVGLGPAARRAVAAKAAAAATAKSEVRGWSSSLELDAVGGYLSLGGRKGARRPILFEEALQSLWGLGKSIWCPRLGDPPFGSIVSHAARPEHGGRG